MSDKDNKSPHVSDDEKEVNAHALDNKAGQEESKGPNANKGKNNKKNKKKGKKGGNNNDDKHADEDKKEEEDQHTE